MAEEPAWGIRRDERGVNALGKLEDGKCVGVVLNEAHVRQGDEPAVDDLRAWASFLSVPLLLELLGV